jgi:hypothetical protein
MANQPPKPKAEAAHQPPRANLTLRIRGVVLEKLRVEAKRVGYSVSEFVERLIESRFEPPPNDVLTADDRAVALQLLVDFKNANPALLIEHVLSFASNEDQRRDWWHSMSGALSRYRLQHGLKDFSK